MNAPIRKILRALIALLFFGLWESHLTAQERISADELVQRLQDVYEKTQDLRANFEQKTIIQVLERAREARGKIDLKKPGKMRWRYLQGEDKEIIINGEKMWIYDPLENQVTITDLSRSPEMRPFITPLMGMGNLKEDFEIVPERPIRRDGKGHLLLELRPRDEQSPIRQLSLLIDEKTFPAMGTSFLGLQGDPTVIRYSNIQINQGLPDELFTFSIPSGAEILHYPPLPEPSK